MKKISDVYEECSIEDLVNSGYNWETKKGEFEKALKKEADMLANLDWKVNGWVKVKDGKDIPVIRGEDAGYLLKLEDGDAYGLVIGEPDVIYAEELEEIVNR